MSVYRLSSANAAILREHATTAAERIALDRLEAFEGDAGDVERALAICVRTVSRKLRGKSLLARSEARRIALDTTISLVRRVPSLRAAFEARIGGAK